MSASNLSFLNLKVGDIIEVRPNLSDREWTGAEVIKHGYTDIPAMHLELGYKRRHEIMVRLIDRTHETAWILSEKDVRSYG